ncbi:MAG: FAD-dependent monooxygenase, partial [Terrimicrobiaceae bacterium]|nr:FAD-dependent monooxygenase [Terrimicrobiaceae bacterium]
RPAILHYVFGGDFFEFFVAVDGKDLWLMHHFLEPGEKIEELSMERLCEMVRRAAGFESLPVKILGVSPWVMSPAVSESWRRGRVFLAGDAAARLSPAGGLGLNTGLQGVWNLAWKIGEVAAGRAGEPLLETYEAERRPWALRLMGASNSNAEEIFTAVAAAMTGDWQRVREMAASSRRHIPDTSLDLGGAYEVGAFLADEPRPEEGGAMPGARVPHVPLAHGKSLVEFCGRGFLLVAGREGARWKDAQGLEALVNGMDIFGEGLESLLGIGPAGAVLVRPDGVVGARFSSGGEPALAAEALRKILNPPAPAPVLFP